MQARVAQSTGGRKLSYRGQHISVRGLTVFLGISEPWLHPNRSTLLLQSERKHRQYSSGRAAVFHPIQEHGPELNMAQSLPAPVKWSLIRSGAGRNAL